MLASSSVVSPQRRSLLRGRSLPSDSRWHPEVQKPTVLVGIHRRRDAATDSCRALLKPERALSLPVCLPLSQKPPGPTRGAEKCVLVISVEQTARQIIALVQSMGARGRCNEAINPAFQF